VAFELEDPAGDDQEPFALDPLQRWQLNNELIRAQARAVDRGEAIEPVRTERLARIQRRGELAPGAFGEALAEELAAPMADLFQRYQGGTRALAPAGRGGRSRPVRIQVEGQTLELADWLGAIRLDAAGQRGRVVLESSDLVKDGQYRGTSSSATGWTISPGTWGGSP
jgi:exodeoxyribonuclease V gamma subunit